MRRTMIRTISVGAAAAVVAAAASGAALSNHGGRFAQRQGTRAGGNFLGLAGGGMFGFGGGPGGGPGRMMGGGMGQGMAFGRGPGGPGGGGGGAGVLTADIITPSAAFLGISTSTLITDLAGGKTLAQEAVAKGKTAADLITAVVANEKLVLDGEKAAGWITADQETSVLSNFTDQVTNLVNSGPSVPRGGGAGDQAQGPLQLASAYLGVSASDIQTALQGGKTLASLIVAPKTVDGLVAAIEAPTKTHLDTAVTAGDITAAQETAILSRLTTQITNFVNGTKPSQGQMNTIKKNLRTFAVRMFGKRH